MMLNYARLAQISQEYGDSFYLLDSGLYEDNYCKMLKAFQKYYTNTHIAYSYKTNYMPKLCRIINRLGGYAEVVSEMELELALNLGVEYENIYYNGPYKKEKYIEEIMLGGGYLNIDAGYETVIVSEIAERHRDKQFAVGVRYNMDIGQDVPSRFGIPKEELKCVVEQLNSISNLRVVGLHCHLPFRSQDSFRDRMTNLKELLYGEMKDYAWSYISLGGGYMGEVSEELAGQFSFVPPAYEDYAKIVAGQMAEFYQNCSERPRLIIEPGSALVANTMRFIARVVNIKRVRGKAIATLTGSTYNMNPSVKSVKRPITVYSDKESEQYEDLDMAGYTCIESDYLYKGYSGSLSVGDFVVFHNVGSYSIVMKPPFILPDVPILEFEGNDICLIKRKQSNACAFMDFLPIE